MLRIIVHQLSKNAFNFLRNFTFCKSISKEWIWKGWSQSDASVSSWIRFEKRVQTTSGLPRRVIGHTGEIEFYRLVITISYSTSRRWGCSFGNKGAWLTESASNESFTTRSDCQTPAMLCLSTMNWEIHEKLHRSKWTVV